MGVGNHPHNFMDGMNYSETAIPYSAKDFEERMPRSIAIVGYSNVNLKFAKNSTADEIWTMNHHVFLQERLPDETRDLFRCDRLFELHHPEWFTRKEVPNALLYRAWLGEVKPFPIYMIQPSPEFPSSVAFPREILKQELFSNLIRGGKTFEYYTSSVAMMVAFAIHLGVERIEFYGVEALTDTEYADQKPCIEFWIGMAAGRGIEIVFHETCSLCNAKVYGYEGVPHLTRPRILELKRHYEALQEKYEREANQALREFNSGKDKNADRAMNAIDLSSMHKGVVIMLETLLQEHDEYISAQFLEEKQTAYHNQGEEFKGRANMGKAKSELLIEQGRRDEAKKVWSVYQDNRAQMMAFHGAVQVVKKLREECRLGKPDHTLVKLIVE